MRTVLVVEDLALLRIVLAHGLAQAGYHVMQASNGEQAASLLRSGGFDAVITDVELPGALDGFELARQVRLMYPGTLVVIASGKSCSEPEPLPKGCHWIAKPYTVETVVGFLGKHLNAVEPQNPSYRSQVLDDSDDEAVRA